MDLLDIDKLLDIIQLEKIDTCLFKGNNVITPWGRVFGGQVLAQALNAAYQTVPEDRFAHSFHGYFILPGDVNRPIIYTVEILRDGGSFTTRRVTASQNGKAIFVMASSFQLKQDGFNHAIEMPEVIPPEDLLTDIVLAEQLKEEMPDVYLKVMSRSLEAIKFKPEDQFDFDKMDVASMVRNVWMKLNKKQILSVPLQHQLLAYASDYDLLITSIIPHRTKENAFKFFIASLDHAMWFHRDFDLNDWLLYNINSPSASNARGMGHGKIFDKKGRLVCTVMQEGLIRLNRN